VLIQTAVGGAAALASSPNGPRSWAVRWGARRPSIRYTDECPTSRRERTDRQGPFLAL
jgi:hypothetical protein